MRTRRTHTAIERTTRACRTFVLEKSCSWFRSTFRTTPGEYLTPRRPKSWRILVAPRETPPPIVHRARMDHSGHAHQMMGGGMSGDGGGGHAMTGMTGMPVAFEWGHRVTLFSHAWATETGFEYCVALAGIFLLCLAQEQLYYFRTTVRVGERPAASEDLSAPIVPKPYRCESPAKEPATMTNYPWTRGCTEPTDRSLTPSIPLSSQRSRSEATRGGYCTLRLESRVELPHHARGDDVQRRFVRHRRMRFESRAFFGAVQAPRAGAGILGGMPPRGLEQPGSGTWTERARARRTERYDSL